MQNAFFLYMVYARWCSHKGRREQNQDNYWQIWQQVLLQDQCRNLPMFVVSFQTLNFKRCHRRRARRLCCQLFEPSHRHAEVPLAGSRSLRTCEHNYCTWTETNLKGMRPRPAKLPKHGALPAASNASAPSAFPGCSVND